MRMKFCISLVLCWFVYQISGAQTIHYDFFDGMLHIKMKADFADALPTYEKNINRIEQVQDSRLRELITKYNIKLLKKATRLQHPLVRPFYELHFTDATDVYALKKELSTWNEIELVEQVAIMRACQSPPNDVNTNQWYLNRINAVGAWNITTGSPEVVIAIVDDAVRITHNDLAANMWQNPGEIPNNNFDDDGNGYTDDYNGFDVADVDGNPMPPTSATNTNFTHGTHCAGIASAVTNNGTGIAGMGYKCKIMAVKCKRNTDTGPNITNAYQGVEYAIAAKANVISMSWGGNQSNNLLQSLMNLAHNEGIVLVAAAGNDNTNEIFYPAGYNRVIAVGATNNQDRKAGFSNYGSYIDVMAPGQQIYSTLAGSNTSYGNQSGTSMACPLVAGLCGLMFANKPDITPEQVEECLKSSCVNIDQQNTTFVGQMGAGRIDAAGAVGCIPFDPVPNDAAIAQIIAPGSFSCDPTITPVVRIANTGTNTISSVKIIYSIGDGPVQSYDWSGTLYPNFGVNVTLSPLTMMGSGTFTFSVKTELPNGVADDNPQNDAATVDVALLPPVVGLPFSESFESGDLFNHDWTVENPDGDLTWEVVNTVGSQTGEKSARVNLYNYASRGQRDGLVTPPIDLANASNIKLSFRHAYRRYGQQYRDSLIVYASTDCGATFKKRIFVGGGGAGFATGPIIGQTDFVPTGDADWCGSNSVQGAAPCTEVSLNQFAGQKVVLKFEIYNDYGNNIYLDNINIDGIVTTSRVETNSFNMPQIYPNPSSGKIWVQNLNESAHWEIFNTAGQRCLLGNINPNDGIDCHQLPAGVYSLQLKTQTGGNFTYKLVLYP